MKSKIILSFDDGRKDNYEIAKSILLPKNLKATFNITTGWVDGTASYSLEEIASGEMMTISEVQDLYNCGFEIACHSDSHVNDINDIKKSIQKLNEWLNTSDNIGFASPNSNLDFHDVIEDREKFENIGISYVRLCMRDTKSIVDGLCRHMPGKLPYYMGYRKEFLTDADDFVLFSVPIKRDTHEEYVEYLITKAIKNNKDLILMLHSINELQDPWSWSRDNFNKLCIFLSNQKEVDVCNTKDLIRQL